MEMRWFARFGRFQRQTVGLPSLNAVNQYADMARVAPQQHTGRGRRPIPLLAVDKTQLEGIDGCCLRLKIEQRH